MKIEPFALERYFAAHEFRARHLMCASDCETLSIGELLALEPGAERELAGLRLGYTETAGSLALRREIASLYKGITASDILVCAGAEEAIFIFMNAALVAGDHVMVHSPCYQSLASTAAAAGCRVSRWEASASAAWAPDVGRLAGQIEPATRAIVVNFPHNPTGYLPDKKRFAAIVKLARRNGLLLFCDEVYRFLEYRESERLPAACETYENGVSLGVMSKSFGLAGLRLGWIASRNRRVLRAMARMKDYTTICSAAPSEFLARLALRRRREILERNRGIVRLNLEALAAFFRRHGSRFSWRRPKAGPVAFPAVRFAADCSGFCADLLRRTGVLLAPGRLFGAAPAHFRVGFGRRDFMAGLERLDEYLKQRH